MTADLRRIGNLRLHFSSLNMVIDDGEWGYTPDAATPMCWRMTTKGPWGTSASMRTGSHPQTHHPVPAPLEIPGTTSRGRGRRLEARSVEDSDPAEDERPNSPLMADAGGNGPAAATAGRWATRPILQAR